MKFILIEPINRVSTILNDRIYLAERSGRMKIQGPHLSHINAYKQQQQKPTQTYKEDKNDKLNISSEAKLLQEHSKSSLKRDVYVQEIKKAVEAGEYKVNVEKTAQKMIDFWSKRI